MFPNDNEEGDIKTKLSAPLQYSIAQINSSRKQLDRILTNPTPPATERRQAKHTNLPQISPRLIVFVSIGILFMASIFSRLLRPFTTSTSLSASPMASPDGYELATVAAGCFWGVEHMFRKEFKDKGLHDARVGYIGGDTNSPNYRGVCSGNTGHAEALQISFDPSKVTYRTLVEYFYKMHDPTTANRQGPDTGSQYRSGIFFHSPEQESVAREVTKLVNEKWWKGNVVTEILPAGTWWDAEEYHQKYLNKNSGGYECPSHFVRKFPAL